MPALLVLIYLAFISLGLPDGLLGVAWPAMRQDLLQPLAAVGLISATVTISAALSAHFCAPLLRWLGTGRVVASSGLLTGLALLAWSQSPSLALLVLAAVPLGVGAGTVDVALNHFVAEHYPARHMNWLHACWGVGATSGPLIMGLSLALPQGWRLGILHIAGLQLLLAALLWWQLKLWAHAPNAAACEQAAAAEAARTRHPHARWLAPLGFFLYVGAEMGTGLWAASVLVGARGLDKASASAWVSVYFGAITLGRVLVGVLAARLSNRAWIRLGLGVASTGALLFASGVPGLSLLGLPLMGLGCAPIFPSMMHETARRFAAPDVVRMISRQMLASYAAGALLPAALGLWATWAGLQAVMPLVLVCLLALALVMVRLDRLS